MDVLLREVRDGPGGIAAFSDTELSTRVVSIGCAPDQQVQLLGRAVGARHAVIRGGARRPTLLCLDRCRATVNGEVKRSARLAVGDSIEIGGHLLIMSPPPAGFDLAIELRPNTKIDRSDFEAAFRADLQQTWLGKRWTAWLLIVLTASVGFVGPFLAVSGHGADLPGSRWLPVASSASALWSTGPLSPGHGQLMGGRCAECHQALFTEVQDQACRSCHTRTGDHVAPSRLAQTALGPAQRCAACHREHEESGGTLTGGNRAGGNLVDRSDKVCVGCHANAPATFGGLKVSAVSGFGAGRHPAFAATAQLQDAVKARAALKFSHAQHLDGARVRKSDRGVLGCADCHKLANDGEHFEATTMAANCAGCHALTFDPKAPDRQLPHGKPRDVVRTLQDYFVHKLRDPSRAQEPSRERRRLPGQEEDDKSGDPACQGLSTYRCAMQMAADAVQTEFERRGCVSCHQVKDTRNKDLTERFQVEPIRLLHDYFPAARFPHRRHLIQGGVGGDAACLSCHPATNAQAGALLLPDLPTCATCHLDAPTRDRTWLQCVSCHTYHPHIRSGTLASRRQ